MAMGMTARLSEYGAGALHHIRQLKKAWQSRLRVVTGQDRSSEQTVYFLTPDYNIPSGGIRVIYRHVDILNAAGIRACVLHQRPGFRCTWFDNETRVASVREKTVLRGDTLVVPELFIGVLDQIEPGTRYVIFNQNSHLTWNGNARRLVDRYTLDSGLLGVITVSEHNQDMLNYAFGCTNIYRLHLGIDTSLFHCAAGPRANRIAYMPRRMAGDARQVVELLRGRGLLRDWEIVPLDGLTEAEVASQLGSTRIFLAFAYQEGFGLPPAEAMACGNYVIGNCGFAGKEFFRPEFSTLVAAGDVVGFAKSVERVLARELEEPGWCEARGKEAARFIGKEYSVVREREEVVAVYRHLLAAAPSERSAPVMAATMEQT